MSASLATLDGHVVSTAILAWIGQALLFGTALAGVTWLLTRPLRRRAYAGLEAALWSIVLIKFLIPVGPGWSLSLTSVCQTLSRHAPGAAVTARIADPDPTATTAAPVPGRQHGGANRAQRPWRWTALVAAAYLAGAVALLAIRTRSYRSLRARCRALPPADESTHRLVHDVCRRLGVLRIPSIRIDEECPAPFILGFFRPLLVLSHLQLVRPDELETVIVHEVSHLRRGDMFVRYLQWIAGTLLFFWPVVAWVNRRIDAAREHACDEWALRHGKLTAGEYARCLLNAVRPMRCGRLSYQPAFMAANPNTIERRIDMILQSPDRPARRRVWGLLTIVFLLAWGGLTLTGPAHAQEHSKANEPKYLATEKDMDLHAKAVYARVNEYAAGDQNGDGVVSKEECWDFVTAVVLAQPQVVLREYPEADYNKDGELELTEVYLFVRGDHEIEHVQKEAQGDIVAAKKAGDPERAKEIKDEIAIAEIEAWHLILDRRDQLLDMINVEPNVEEVKAVADKMAKIKAKRAGKGTLDEKTAEIAGLKKKASGLRTKAAKIGDGEKAAAYEAKSQQLEQKAADMQAKLVAGIKGKIAKLEAAGKQEKAAELRDKLAELEEE